MEKAGWERVRSADDRVILSRGEAEAQRALETVRQWVREAGLSRNDAVGKGRRATRRRLARRSAALMPLPRPHGKVGSNESSDACHWPGEAASRPRSGRRSTASLRLRSLLQGRLAGVGKGIGATPPTLAERMVCALWADELESRTRVAAYNRRTTNPTDWSAGCGKSARPVRREGQGQSLVPTPILFHFGVRAKAGTPPPALPPQFPIAFTRWQISLAAP